MRRIPAPLTFLVIMLVLFGAVACTSGASPTPTSDPVQAFADPATETTLQGLSEGNLAKYTQYGNTQFKAAVTPEVMTKTAAQITAQLGTYVSKQFLKTEEQGGYILVHYKAKFTKGEAGIRMVFDKDHLVAGQWFE